MSYGIAQPSILGAIGSTPLVGLKRIVSPSHARVLVKCEFFNPLSSVKDRVGLAMIEAAEQAGPIRPGSHIVEPTSGNTGVALAFAAAAKGYKLTLAIPESMSHERRGLLLALGAQYVLTPANEGMAGAQAAAEELLEEIPHAWMPRQFENPANPDVHRRTTGPEVWVDAQGHVDVLVAGVGTGGTITGVGQYLRKHNPKLEIIAVEPTESAVLSGGRRGPHGIQGIGPGFVPKNLDRELLNSVETVTTDEAFFWSRRLAREEGLLGGISSGANVAVAARLAALPRYRGMTIVTFASSSGERYLSTKLYELVGMPPLPAALVG